MKTGKWDCTMCRMLQTFLLSIHAGKLSASLPGACLTSFTIHRPKLLTLLLLGKNQSFEVFSTPQHMAEFIQWVESIKRHHLPPLFRQRVPGGKLSGEPLSCKPLEGLKSPQGQFRWAAVQPPQSFLHFTLLSYLLLQARVGHHRWRTH